MIRAVLQAWRLPSPLLGNACRAAWTAFPNQLLAPLALPGVIRCLHIHTEFDPTCNLPLSGSALNKPSCLVRQQTQYATRAQHCVSGYIRHFQDSVSLKGVAVKELLVDSKRPIWGAVLTTMVCRMWIGDGRHRRRFLNFVNYSCESKFMEAALRLLWLNNHQSVTIDHSEAKRVDADPQLSQLLRDFITWWKGRKFWGTWQPSLWRWYHRHGYWATRKKLLKFDTYRKYRYHEVKGYGKPPRQFWECPSDYKPFGKHAKGGRFWLDTGQTGFVANG
eukprot:GHVT01004226.1.p1 GENE.GHVT01004226.1~~GHVT01004226.1.p1  ORF type:complete len:277 (+),score=-3.15 GHVT01004226.1:143-973(+)